SALSAGLVDPPPGAECLAEGRHLRLRIPAGAKPIRCTLWIASAHSEEAVTAIARAVASGRPGIDLEVMTRGGPPRWDRSLTTEAVAGEGDGPFAADTLTPPEPNPWGCQMRLTGLDFLPGGRLAACTWDGDVWLVGGLDRPGARLAWRRI